MPRLIYVLLHVHLERGAEVEAHDALRTLLRVGFRGADRWVH